MGEIGNTTDNNSDSYIYLNGKSISLEEFNRIKKDKSKKVIEESKNSYRLLEKLED